jgi:hypothetical protein
MSHIELETETSKGHSYQNPAQSLHAAYADMWSERNKAFEMAKQLVAERGRSYKYVVFTRTDNALAAPLILSELARIIDTSPSTESTLIVPGCCDFGGICDRFAAGTWDAMEMYMEPERWIEEYHVAIPTLQEAHPHISFQKQSERNLQGHFFLRNLTRIDQPISFTTLRRGSMEKYCANRNDFETNWTEKTCFKENEDSPRPACPRNFTANIEKNKKDLCSFS